MEVLTRDLILLGARASDKMDAVRQAGEVLVRAGCVAPAYVSGMMAREQVMSTYLGSGIAIPHGELADLQLVFRTGVSVVQLPAGIEWSPRETVYLVIGLAAKAYEHVTVLANLVDLLQEADTIKRLVVTTDPMVIVDRLTRQRSEKTWN